MQCRLFYGARKLKQTFSVQKHLLPYQISNKHTLLKLHNWHVAHTYSEKNGKQNSCHRRVQNLNYPLAKQKLI